MQLSNYCIITGVSIFFLIGCLMHIYENDIFSIETIKKFKRLIYALILMAAIDCVFALLEGQEMVRFVLYLLKGIELVANPLIALLVFDIFYDGQTSKQDKRMKNLRITMIVVIVFNGMLQAAGVISMGGGIFYMDKDNLYHRGELMWIYVLILIFIILVLVYGIFLFSNDTQITMKATLIAFTALLIVGIFLRGIFQSNNYDFLCMAVAMPFLLIYYSHVTLGIDPTTHLMNRHIYMRMIEKINYTTIFIMIDANNFKYVNDEFGHACGDRTLKQIARLIYKSYSKYAYCFRLGGDEFCVILKPGAFDELIEEIPHCDIYRMADKFMGRLDRAIAAQAKADKDNKTYLEYGVSQGCGIFYSPKDYPDMKNRLSFEQVIELADKKMYLSKAKFAKEHPETVVPKFRSSRARVLYEPSYIKLIEDPTTVDE